MNISWVGLYLTIVATVQQMLDINLNLSPLGHGVLSVSVHCVEAALGPRPAAPWHPELPAARPLGSELQVLARHGCHVDSRPQLPPS